MLTRKAVNFVNRRAPRAQPFFLWLTYTAPHIGGPDPNPQPPVRLQDAPKPAPRHAHAFDSEPLPSRPNFNEADVSDKPAAIRNLPRLDADQVADIRRRYRCELESLLSVDEGVKKLVDALRARGELSNTLIIYTSDNGFFHGEHRVFQGKQRIYEESIRVPLQMRGPGIAPGTRVGELSINADLAPTIVAAANASPGLVMDGQSLIPVAQTAETRAAARDAELPASSRASRRSAPRVTSTPSTEAARRSSTTCRTTRSSFGTATATPPTQRSRPSSRPAFTNSRTAPVPAVAPVPSSAAPRPPITAVGLVRRRRHRIVTSACLNRRADLGLPPTHQADLTH